MADVAKPVSDAVPAPAGLGDALPAPTGLGNYKGVMLCNRPDAMESKKLGPAPFKPTVSETYGQPLGLTPCKELPTHETRKQEACVALQKHAAWLKVLHAEMKKHKIAAAAARQVEIEKAKRIRKISERQREGVRKAMEAQRETLVDDLTEAVKAPILTVPVDKKPVWALSQEEKVEYDALEADNLLNFADELDFDSYIHDLEFRQALETLTERAREIEKEQNSFKAELVAALNNDASEVGDNVDANDSASQVGKKDINVKATEASRKNDWDASTTCDEKPEMEQELRSQVDRVLESNSEIRNVHSKESIKKIIEKQRQAGAEELMKTIKNVGETCQPPNPTVVTHDPSVKSKEIDPSMLPYLYRSPAI